MTGELPVALMPEVSKNQWMDQGVLRFYAFFKEAVIDSNVESHRIRRVIIQFYLSDGSLEVVEPRSVNSGIDGGSFLKRGHVPNEDFGGRSYSKNDFFVNSTVSLYGRRFSIYDCDDYTRKLLGNEQCPAGTTPPIDEFSVKKAARKPSSPAKSSHTPRKKRFIVSKSDDSEQTSILRYFAKWQHPDDEEHLELYKIHYYLEDGSIEIIVANKKELRHQMFPTLLIRNVQTKTPAVSVTDIGTDKEYISDDDLRVGSVVTIQDRPMLIYAADDRTYDWVLKNKGVDMRPDEVDVSPPPPETLARPEQDDGEEEDSSPREPPMSAKEKFYKQAHLAGKILRYAATVPLDMRHPSDVDQKFVISYYLADDTISVYCRSPPNSGLTSGLFLNRGKHLNLDTNKFFGADDFYVGARLRFRGKTLVISDVDQYSLAYTHLDVKEIMALIRRKIEERSIELHTTFREFDRDGNQELTYDEFAEAMTGTNLNLYELLTKRDIYTLFRHFDANGSGTISYLEFCNAIQDVDPFHAVQDWDGLNPHEKFIGETMTDEQIEDYVHILHKKELDGKKEIDLETAMSKLVQFTHSHRNASHTSDLFRDFDENHDGTLGIEEFDHVLMEKIHLTKRDVDLIKLKFFEGEVKNLNYDNFLHAIQTYTDAKKKGKFLGMGARPPTIKASSMSMILSGGYS